MRLLLDTYALDWWMRDDARLTTTARVAIEDDGAEVWISPVAAYELGLHGRRGTLVADVAELAGAVRRAGFEVLPIQLEHMAAAASLPGRHQDPWDRIIVAQALAAGLTLVSQDRQLGAFGVPTLW
jgi:PIN domain nuclease of toxin-antitoxin system